MENESCIFCKIVAGQIPAEIIYENDKMIAFLDINPVTKGHTLIVPKKHSLVLHQADKEDVKIIFETVSELAPKIVKFCQADAYNIGVNCGRIAGQAVDHTHVHIIPRYEEDGLKMWGGNKADPLELVELGKQLRTGLAS